MAGNKLTKLEKQWILYDVGNSAFILFATTILPIYFRSITVKEGISEANYLVYWGYLASVSTLLVAILGPILGSVSDEKDKKKKVFIYFLVAGVIGTLLMAFPMSMTAFIIVYIITKVGYNGSIIFYDAMLTDITTPDKMDNVSAQGFAWGYIGSVIPFVASLGIIMFNETINISQEYAMSLSFIITALWWVAFTLPLLKNYEQKYYIEAKRESMIDIFKRLGKCLIEIKESPKIFLFLIAFFFYIDGVYTIISMATAYGTSLGLDSQELLQAFLFTQVIAFPCALIFAKLAKKVDTGHLIKVCIIAYTGITLFGMQLDKEWKFWVLATLVGMFQGGVQALSRSYFAKIIPKEKSGEYFGLFDIFGKGATILGTLSISIMTSITNNQRSGLSIIVLMFILGYYFFHKSNKIETKE